MRLEIGKTYINKRHDFKVKITRIDKDYVWFVESGIDTPVRIKAFKTAFKEVQ